MNAWLTPYWPAPACVRALVTTRGIADGSADHTAAGGASRGSYACFNLGMHVGDDAAAVTANRARLRALLPAEPLWLSQVHGTRVLDADAILALVGTAATHGAAVLPPEADAAVAHRPGAVLAILTADCMPVLLCDRQGSVV
ncbi:MAG: hypothetical protein FJY55_08735, partial [Betaproteobacteria bacterium]|nr:hypothetical protein [Betaproteobacteria bacterium]